MLEWSISYKYYPAVEAGRKRELRLSTLERLARAYGLEVWQLLAPDLPEGMMAAKRLAFLRTGRTAQPTCQANAVEEATRYVVNQPSA